ncbi:flagellar assembly protein A [Clostridium cellulovorans]|uniref:RNA-binding protein KhpB N-terminal domain-containing protein n=1 Tax=Clostridium cellulovorans (strain ATCC 35296 / DSM 3052 / OCM 3 / 743B) TaxID=573061 RepID=D9SKD6_CLOC7|nr:flagellar assembly protein A [Clostridium cellulovorans]ADL51432.1 protein of unknown function DUF342 [Clostridium cellulovorans 743B]
MEIRCFEGKTLEECIEKASEELKISKKDLKYKVIRQKSFFHRSVEIEVTLEENVSEDNSVSENGVILENEDQVLLEKEIEVEKKETINGTISVVDGKIIVKNPLEGGSFAKISADKEIKLLINGKEVTSRVDIKEGDSIETILHEISSKRIVNIATSQDKMEAYIDIKYEPQKVYTLIDSLPSENITLKSRVKQEIFPPKFTVEEIKNYLGEKNIKYGIIEENLTEKVLAEGCVNLKIAVGTEVVNDEDDKIIINFKTNKEIMEEKKDKGQKIDYKSIGYIEPVKKGQVIAELVKGKEGHDGQNILGIVKKKKKGKPLTITAGENCQVVDEKVIAECDGKPYIKKNIFNVFNCHEVSGDVDMKSGNINFIGDVIVKGDVKDGMTVTSGHGVEVHNSVLDAKIISDGDIIVKNNVIHSDLKAGKEDVNKIEYIDHLDSLEQRLDGVIKSYEQLKQLNALDPKTTTGQVIMMLIEKKFSKIPSICKDVIKNPGLCGGKLFVNIKDLLIGVGPSNIKSIDELKNLLQLIKERKEVLKSETYDTYDIICEYCQDSNLECSGDVILTGKGQYVSYISAGKSVIFNSESSIARGGVIKAQETIKVGIVGSEAGVSTKLIVPKTGHIFAEIAHVNTVLAIGPKEVRLDTSCRKLHAYQGEDGTIEVEKFVL